MIVMSRPRIELPSSFTWHMEFPLRITDINYGGHLGNDKVLTLAHEARAAYLRSLGLSELAIGHGAGLIMADAAIEFKAEAHYGDKMRISVSVSNLTRAGFDMIYLLEKMKDASTIVVAIVRTGMVCYDYEKRKVLSIPEEFRKAVTTA